jgi:hypothetical protein
MLLDSAARDRLCKLLGMLGSSHDGEIAAAGRKTHEFLKKHGLTSPDFIAAPDGAAQAPPWRAMVHACLAARAVLNNKEREFVHSMLAWRGNPTAKQIAWLTRIYESLP